MQAYQDDCHKPGDYKQTKIQRRWDASNRFGESGKKGQAVEDEDEDGKMDEQDCEILNVARKSW